MKTEFNGKIYFSVFCPKRLHYFFFEAFFDIFISALYFSCFQFVKFTLFRKKYQRLPDAARFETEDFAPLASRVPFFECFLAFGLKFPIFAGFTKVFAPL